MDLKYKPHQDWILPAGYIDAHGHLHKRVKLMPLRGYEEEMLAQGDYSSTTLVSKLLSRCVKRIGDITEITLSVVNKLTVGDRQYILLMLRQLTFGDRVQASLLCPWPNCGAGVDIDFKISGIPITSCKHQAYYHLQIERFSTATTLGLSTEPMLTIQYRLPNGADQEVISNSLANSNEASAALTLLSRCIKRFDVVDHPSVDWLAQLTPDIRQKIEQDMESRAPNLELTMDVKCQDCERSFVAPFDLQDFFFGELTASTDLLFREVHYLAFHYHWSEQEIMNFPRDRRRRYIELLSDEIEKLNEQVE